MSLKDAANDNPNYVSIINKRIKEQIKNRNMELLTPFESIEPDRGYFLNRNGVVVFFTQYEYTSYAEGMPEFVIPYAAFK
ncbi:RsiV family protein [Paenibacillus macerans]|uniref:RsiV family protein n=1 Tax=Paenibacillus macerans TaxID=44252 RepID=UPI003D323C04